MAWRWPGDKPLPEPMMVRLPRHICVTRPQWVNPRPREISSSIFKKHVNKQRLSKPITTHDAMAANALWGQQRPVILLRCVAVASHSKAALPLVKRLATAWDRSRKRRTNPDSKVHGANMGPTWVLPAPGGPHVGPINLVIWEGWARRWSCTVRIYDIHRHSDDRVNRICGRGYHSISSTSTCYY